MMKVFSLSMVILLVLITGCSSNPPPPAFTTTAAATSAPSPVPGTPPASSPLSSPSAIPPAASTAPRPQVKGTFIQGETGGDAETLNVILATDGSSGAYAGYVMESLATYNKQWQLVLRHMAKPLDVSPDGLTYTITIRDDLKWSNGSKVTSEDYVYTLKNLMFSDWLNYPYASDWQEEVGGKTVFVKVEAVNETTFKIVRQNVDPEFADNAIYGLSPYPKYILVKYEGDVKAFTQAPEFNNLSYTGNLGPYKFKEWIRDDKFVVVRNPDYYLGKEDGSPYFESFEIKIFGTSATAMAALEAGDITMTGIEPSQVAKYKQMAKLKVYTSAMTSYDIVTLNLRKNGWEGLRDKTVRQAISMCISREQVVNSVRFGFGEPAASFIPKISPWYTETGVPLYGVGPLYDKEKARQMLFDAGYGVKGADGKIKVQNKDGKPITLTFVTTPGNSIAENQSFLVKQELGSIGINVEIKTVQWATLLRQYMENKVPGSNQELRDNNGPDAVSEQPWDMMGMMFGTGPLAPSGSNVFFTTDGGLNFMGYSNPRVDDLFKRVKSKEALDTTARKQMYADLSRILAEDQPSLFMDFPRGNAGFQKYVAGIDESPGMRLGWNYHKWYFQQPQ